MTGLNENPYSFPPKMHMRKELRQAIIESTALAQASYHPNVGWCLPMVVQVDGVHYPVPQYINIGVQWAANAGVLSPLGRELVDRWMDVQTPPAPSSERLRSTEPASAMSST